MKQNVLKTLSLLMSAFVLCLFAACGGSDDPTPKPTPDPDPDPDPVITVNQKVNKFVVKSMKELYLWNDKIPSTVKEDSDTEPVDYLTKTIRYNTLDKWTNLTNTAKTRAEVDETSKEFGYYLYLQPVDLKDGQGVTKEIILAYVNYVNPNSPAKTAGLKRGDMILKNGGDFITRTNFMDLYNANSLSLTLGAIIDGKLDQLEGTINLTAETKVFDTVVHDEIIEYDDKKIGYICYTGYTFDSELKLLNIITNFKTEGVTDVILDLRYNPGGYAKVAQNLSSMLAPPACLDGKTVFLEERWNDGYMAYYKQQGEDLNQYFVKDIPVNLDLTKLCILTSKGTASASEATLVGLRPYLGDKLVHIGTTTHGKYVGGIDWTPEDLAGSNIYTAKEAAEIKDWELMVIIYKYVSSSGETDFTNGLTPANNNIAEEVKEGYLPDLKPLGSKEDPLVAKALERITGNAPAQSRSTSVQIPAKELPGVERPGGMIVRKEDLPASFYK